MSFSQFTPDDYRLIGEEFSSLILVTYPFSSYNSIPIRITFFSRPNPCLS